MSRLTTEQHTFLDDVARIGFANPFSTARERMACERCGLPLGSPPAAVLRALLHRVAEFLATLQRSGQAHLAQHDGADRESLKFLILFDMYHRTIDDFDALIPRQIAAGEASQGMPASERMMRELLAAGFRADEAARGIGLCWQVRRAYFFIAHKLTGESPCMRQLRERLWTNVFTCDSRAYLATLWDRMEDFSTLLLGETGCGKGMVAFAIGCSGFIPYEPETRRFSTSFTRAFVALNLSQYPETLIESELFGHRKGAFTGAVEAHEGVFARCSPYGAIFLDEIGEVSGAVQIKLLRVLQERVFQPVGSHQPRRFAGRVIAATNQPLDRLRAEGRFRDDFYYRLCSDTISIPSLRERLDEDPDELQRLCGTILERISGRADGSQTEAVAESLRRGVPNDYRWPGNVRELEQAVRRILLTGHYQPPVAALQPPPADEPPWIRAARQGELSANALLAAYCRELYRQHNHYGDVARITGLNWRTVKKYVGADPITP